MMKSSHLRQQLHTYNAIYKETDALYSELARRSGLSDCAFWLLYSLRDTEGICRQKDICGQWTLSKQTVNSALKRLESQGLIILEPEAGNAKSKRILLTDQGDRFAEQHIDQVFELEQRVLHRMGEAAVEAMLDTNRCYLELFREEIHDRSGVDEKKQLPDNPR